MAGISADEATLIRSLVAGFTLALGLGLARARFVLEAVTTQATFLEAQTYARR